MSGPILAPTTERFNFYDAVRRLDIGDLLIHTIPGEEWRLSCRLHKTLLVDVYTLTGRIAGKNQIRTYQCGRLCEILLKMLCVGRRVQAYAHAGQRDNDLYRARLHTRLAETLEDELKIRLHSGDIIFRAIPEKQWRLTNTNFGSEPLMSFNMFYLADEETLNTPAVHWYKGTKLEHVLLEWLCQDVAFVEHQRQARVLEFKSKIEQ